MRAYIDEVRKDIGVLEDLFEYISEGQVAGYQRMISECKAQPYYTKFAEGFDNRFRQIGYSLAMNYKPWIGKLFDIKDQLDEIASRTTDEKEIEYLIITRERADHALRYFSQAVNAIS